jgi:4'-phosphopantetheinyl transferase
MTYGLKQGEVAVWWMALKSPPTNVIARWYACLGELERVQAERFHFREDRETYIAAHWMVRTALTSVGGLPPREWRFAAGKFGKPLIDPALGRPELRFNLSHTRSFVACTVNTSNEIGIDVEILSDRHWDIDMAERFFSPLEVAILRATAPDRQQETFFRFWTLKEAFIKATGEGLNRELDSFSFALDPVSILFGAGHADNATRWQFSEYRPTAQHLLALAIERPEAYPASLIVRPVHCPSV